MGVLFSGLKLVMKWRLLVFGLKLYDGALGIGCCCCCFNSSYNDDDEDENHSLLLWLSFV